MPEAGMSDRARTRIRLESSAPERWSRKTRKWRAGEVAEWPKAPLC
jgi:hypothetical protein